MSATAPHAGAGSSPGSRRSARQLVPRFGVRARLTTAVCLVFSLALGGGATLLLGQIERALIDDVHTTARSHLERAMPDIAAGPGRVGTELTVDGDQMTTTVIVVGDDPGGITVGDGDMLTPAGRLRAELTTQGATVPDWLAATESLVAVSSVAAATPDGEVQLLTASPLDEVRLAVATTRKLLWVAIPALVAMIGVMAWVVASRALRPVQAIAGRADAITAATPDGRVPVPGTGDEIAHLAQTVNRMLGRLQAAAVSQRRFTADAAHELRTPVATIRTELEVALRDDDVHWPQVAQRVLAEDRRLAGLVDDLLLLARSDEPASTSRFTDVDLDDVVRNSGARSRSVPLHLRQVVPTRIRGDATSLERAVDHLLDNAARHAESTAAVIIEPGDDVIHVHVDDDGTGIAEADRDRVLERFTRLDEGRARDRGGAGLGLAVVHRVARSHGGAVTVTVAPLGGARVTMSLPRSGALENDDHTDRHG